MLLDKRTPQSHPDKRFYNSAVKEDVNVVCCASRKDGLWVFSTFIPTDIQFPWASRRSPASSWRA